MAEARYPVEPLTRFTSDLLAAAGLEREKAQTVARLLVTDRHAGPPYPRGGAVPALRRAAREGADDAARRARMPAGQRCRRGLGRQLPAGPVAGASGARHRLRARRDTRGGHLRDAPQPPHRLPGDAREAGDGPRLRRHPGHLRPCLRLRRPLRRARAAAHAQPVRHRLSRDPHARPGRHLRVDHDGLDDAPEGCHRRGVRASLAARRRRAADQRSARARADRSRAAACCCWAGSSTATRASASR